MPRTAAISHVILTLFRATGDLRQAFDTVLGAGAYDRLAGQVYDALRAKTAR